MSTPTVLSLVHEGWHHLRLQRPLAAWAAWQRALRVEPDDAAARQALGALESAAELPVAARAVYRFQTPADEARRTRWDARFREAGAASASGLDDLGAAGGVFSRLADDDPTDVAACYNAALCLAWRGRNAEAVAALDRVVTLRAGDDPDRASEAWTLAEVLRLGAGAESLADDLRHAWVADRPDDLGPVDDLPDRWPGLRPVAVPTEPPGGVAVVDARVFEWLDRPLGPTGTDGPPVRADEVARVRATVVVTPRSLRLSTPDPTGFEALADPPMADVARLFSRAVREASPLPLAWADAALGTFRFPPGLDAEAIQSLTRGVVERYYETVWVHGPRHALDGRSPLAASRIAAAGDAVTRAKLEGVVRFREQLGTRPTHALLYQGYPFDRLRRRLGLIGPESTGVVDPDDLTCFSEPELDAADPAGLDGERLADAFSAAAGFGVDARTARFAGELARREPASLARLDLEAVFAPLVREAIRDGDPPLALERLARARAISRDPARQRTFSTWTAEVLARSGQFEEALATYRSLLAGAPPGVAAAAALDGAETLLDNGAPGEARPLLAEARALALSAGDAETAGRAAALLAGTDE